MRTSPQDGARCTTGAGPAARPLARRGRPPRAPRSRTGVRREDVIPCLGNSPRPCVTWQRPQIPRPPQTESMSTPSERAASRTVVPVGEPAAPARRREDDERLLVAAVDRLAVPRRRDVSRPARRRLTRRRLTSPSGVGARWARIQRPQSGSLPISTSAAMTLALTSGISGFVIAEVSPLAIAIGRNGGVDALAVRQPEADVRRAAGRVDPELVAQPADEREDLPAGGRHRADRHDQRVDDDVRAPGCRGRRRARRSASRPRTGRPGPR